MARLAIPQTVAEWNQRGGEYLPGRLGTLFLAVEPGTALEGDVFCTAR